MNKSEIEATTIFSYSYSDTADFSVDQVVNVFKHTCQENNWSRWHFSLIVEDLCRGACSCLVSSVSDFSRHAHCITHMEKIPYQSSTKKSCALKEKKKITDHWLSPQLSWSVLKDLCPENCMMTLKTYLICSSLHTRINLVQAMPSTLLYISFSNTSNSQKHMHACPLLISAQHLTPFSPMSYL